MYSQRWIYSVFHDLACMSIFSPDHNHNNERAPPGHTHDMSTARSRNTQIEPLSATCSSTSFMLLLCIKMSSILSGLPMVYTYSLKSQDAKISSRNVIVYPSENPRYYSHRLTLIWVFSDNVVIVVVSFLRSFHSGYEHR